MRIRMLRNALGSPDGIATYVYEATRVYAASDPDGDGALATSPLPLSNRLAALFVAEGWAEDAETKEVEADAAPVTALAAVPEPMATATTADAPVVEPAPSPTTPEPVAES